MTAYRVVDDHKELDNVGSLTHDQLDSHVSGTSFLIVSGPLPPAGRILTAGSGVTLVDGGPGGLLTISSTGGSGIPGGLDTFIQFNDGGVFGGVPSFTFDKTTGTLTVPSLSGSLTRLTDGSSYLVAGDGISITTGSNGSVTITSIVTGSGGGASGTITEVIAGNGLTGGGTSGSVTLSINDSVVATVSGTTFTGITKHNAGLSGSLTRLVDGSPYLVAGPNVGIVNNPNGSITITAAGAGVGSTSFTSWMEVPTGDVDGINMVFSLTNVPDPPNALMIYVNGVLQLQGISYDYALSGNTLAFNTAPISGSYLVATYAYTLVLPTGPVFNWMEVPFGTADGINTSFILAQSPYPAGSLLLYVNGVLQRQGASYDYTLSNNIVTMNSPPLFGSQLVASYAYSAAPPVGKNTMWLETPSGVTDGMNNTFTVSSAPDPGSTLMFYVNGVLARQGASADYVLSGTTITMNYVPASGSNLAASYPY